jgi:hypothetical protein
MVLGLQLLHVASVEEIRLLDLYQLLSRVVIDDRRGSKHVV